MYCTADGLQNIANDLCRTKIFTIYVIPIAKKTKYDRIRYLLRVSLDKFYSQVIVKVYNHNTPIISFSKIENSVHYNYMST